MFSKVICFVAFIAIACSAPQHQQAARYPAGVNPALCPGFPICDNSLLHGTAPVPQAYAHQPQPQWNPAPHSWNTYAAQPQWNQWNTPLTQQWDDSSNDLSGTGGDKYPAGINPATCPNYPYCDTGAGAAAHAPAAIPLPGYTSRLYPAGVNPAACPNYPICH